jgi:hypothetical protein
MRMLTCYIGLPQDMQRADRTLETAGQRPDDQAAPGRGSPV